MMSYVLRTTGGAVIVIDGGSRDDAPFLRDFLHPLGGRVTAWFLTHPHYDHIDALTELLSHDGGPVIDAVYDSSPEEEWIAEWAPGHVASLLPHVQT